MSENKNTFSVKNLAIAGMMAALSVIVLFLTALFQWNTLFLLALAAYLCGTVCRYTSTPISCASLTATVFLGFWIVPVRMYVFFYFFLAVYVIVSQSFSDHRKNGKPLSFAHEWILKAFVWHLLLILGSSIGLVFFTVLTGVALPEGGSLINILKDLLSEQDRFPQWISHLPTAGMLLLFLLAADVFWIIFDRAYLYYSRMIQRFSVRK